MSQKYWNIGRRPFVLIKTTTTTSPIDHLVSTSISTNTNNNYNKKYVLWNVYLPSAMNSTSKLVSDIKCLNRSHIADRDTYFMCKFPVFEIFQVKRWWPKSKTVQCQPRLKIIVPIDSNNAWVVSHSSSIDPIIVSVTFFEIFAIKFNFNDLQLRGLKIIWGSKFIVPIESPLLVSYLTSFESNIVSVTVFEILDIKAIFP